MGQPAEAPRPTARKQLLPGCRSPSLLRPGVAQATTPENGYPRALPRPVTPHTLGPGARRQVQVQALPRGWAGRGPPAPPPTAPPRPHPREPTGRIATPSKTLQGGTTDTYRTTVQHRVPAGSSGKQPQAGATSRPASPTRKRLLQETCEASASNDHLLSPPRPHKAPPTPPQLLKATPLQPEGCGHQDPERKIKGRSHRSAFLCSWD